MTEFLLGVMLVAAALYTVLAGADFGAGIMEGFMGKARERVDGPRTGLEANHVWLVLILSSFVGFPRLYTRLDLPTSRSCSRCWASSRAAPPSPSATTPPTRWTPATGGLPRGEPLTR